MSTRIAGSLLCALSLTLACSARPLSFPEREVIASGGVDLATPARADLAEPGASGCGAAGACVAGVACCPWREPAQGASCPAAAEGISCIYWASDGHTSNQAFCSGGSWQPEAGWRQTSWDYSAECGQGLACPSYVLGCVVASACLRCACTASALQCR